MRKIKSHDEFIEKLKQVNPTISVLSSFDGLSTNKVKCKCTICGFEWDTYPYLLLDGHGCKFCNKKPKGDFKYNIGDTISTNMRNLLIIDREYRKWVHPKTSLVTNKKFYKYRCLDCGNEDWIIEYRLSEKYKDGCNACKSNYNHLIPGVNDIATISPQIATLFKNYDESKSKVRGSKKRSNICLP
jgi:ribosomal protein S27E